MAAAAAWNWNDRFDISGGLKQCCRRRCPATLEIHRSRLVDEVQLGLDSRVRGRGRDVGGPIGVAERSGAWECQTWCAVHHLLDGYMAGGGARGCGHAFN